MSDPTPAPAPEDPKPAPDVPEEEPLTPEEEEEVAEEDEFLTVTQPANSAYQPDVVEADAAAVEDSSESEAHLVETEFTIQSHMDPARQRDPAGVYLDDVDRRRAEYNRAKAEGREPDYENAGPTAGDVVVPTSVAKQLVDGNAVVPVAFTAEVMVGSPPAEEDAEAEAEDSEEE